MAQSCLKRVWGKKRGREIPRDKAVAWRTGAKYGYYK